MLRGKNKKLLLGMFLLFVAVGIGGGVAYWQDKKLQDQLLPKEVQGKLNFVPFTSVKGEAVTAPQEVKYDETVQLLTYQLYSGTTKIIVSQQPTPTNFTEIPQTFDKLLEKMQVQETFDSVNGKVSITYPQELNGTQTAVMNSKGALLFARPDKNLDINEWKKLFSSLVINKN